MGIARDAPYFRRTRSYKMKRGWTRFTEVARMALFVVLFPLRVFGAFWRAAEAAGRAIILGAFHFMLGTFGIVVVGWFCFALIRVLFHPLFGR